MDFFLETIFRPLEVLRPHIFTRASDSPRLASAHPKMDAPPPKKKINRENLTFVLKFSVSITSGLVGVSSRL